MVRIIEIIGSPVAISPLKASLLYTHFVQMFESKTQVVYSLKGIDDCSSAFCNASVGKLYMNYNEKIISSLISFTDFDEEGIWAEKINRAKQLGIEENYRSSNQQTLEEILA